MINIIKEKQISDLALKLPGMVEDARVVVGSPEEEKNIDHITGDIYEYFFDDQDKVDEQFTEETKLYLAILGMDKNSYRNDFGFDLIVGRHLSFQILSDIKRKSCRVSTFLLDNAIAANIAWHDILKKLNAARINPEKGPNKKLERLFARAVTHYWSEANENTSEWCYKAVEKGLEQYRAYIFRDADFIFKHNLPISEESKQALSEFIKRTLDEKKQYVLDWKEQIVANIQACLSNVLERLNTRSGHKNTGNANSNASLMSLMSAIFSSRALDEQEGIAAQELEPIAHENQQKINGYATVGNSPQVKFACRLRFMNLLPAFSELIKNIEVGQDFPLEEMIGIIQEITQLIAAYKSSCSIQEAEFFNRNLEQELQSIIQPFNTLFSLQKVLYNMAVINNQDVVPVAKKLKPN